MDPDKDFNLVVGLRIREIREALNLTRASFSEKCNISESFLTAVENGQKSITSKTIYKICTAFNISADYLIRGNKENFETDSIIELLHSLDSISRESALIILREFVHAISTSNK